MNFHNYTMMSFLFGFVCWLLALSGSSFAATTVRPTITTPTPFPYYPYGPCGRGWGPCRAWYFGGESRGAWNPDGTWNPDATPDPRDTVAPRWGPGFGPGWRWRYGGTWDRDGQWIPNRPPNPDETENSNGASDPRDDGIRPGWGWQGPGRRWRGPGWGPGWRWRTGGTWNRDGTWTQDRTPEYRGDEVPPAWGWPQRGWGWHHGPSWGHGWGWHQRYPMWGPNNRYPGNQPYVTTTTTSSSIPTNRPTVFNQINPRGRQWESSQIRRKRSAKH